MYIFECKTNKGRTFKVAIANDHQKGRFIKLIEENEEKSDGEKFISVKDILNGIHDIKTFEKICNKII